MTAAKFVQTHLLCISERRARPVLSLWKVDRASVCSVLSLRSSNSIWSAHQ